MTPEGRVKSRLRTRLNAALARSYMFMPVQQGLGATGLDYFCCISSMFVAIETKVPGKKLTPRQMIVAKQILSAGGNVFVVRTDEDINELIVRIGVWERCPQLPYLRTGYLYDKLWPEETP